MKRLFVRVPELDLSSGFARDWLGGDAFRTQLFNAMSMTFPIGEQSFIDSMRAISAAQLRPEQRREIKDFIAQEAIHRRFHMQFNAELERQGLRYIVGPLVRWRARTLLKLSAKNQLAATAAFEHFTAIMAEGGLVKKSWLAGAAPHLQLMWAWHAAEEIEYKSVAFDAYLAVGGGYWRRVSWYIGVMLAYCAETAVQTLHNLHREKQLFKWCTLGSGLRMLFGAEGMVWHALLPGLRYFAPDFHPSQFDNQHLVQGWSALHSDQYRLISTGKNREGE